MENLIKIDTVDQYNKMFGLETLHPLVSVVDLSKSETCLLISGLIMVYTDFS